VEERQATAEVFNDTEGNKHFVAVGRALGLVRIKDLHLGKITDLEQRLKQQDQDQQHERTSNADSKPEPVDDGGRDTNLD
jgi:hypothetical protein